VLRGWSIVDFAITRARAAHDPSGEAVRAWIGDPGLTGPALRAALSRTTIAADRETLRRRADDLTLLLATHPLSSAEWLSLAGIRLALAQPYDTVLAALAMSSLTGPNEGAMMMQRGIFGVLQWEALPADARRRTIGDLAGAARGEVIRGGALMVIKNVLHGKSPETRTEIGDLLRAEQVPDRELTRLGL